MGAVMNLFIRKKAYNLLDRYDILDDTGRLAYTADGFLTRLKGSLVMRDRAGAELLTLRKDLNPLFCQYTIASFENPEKILATMRQQFSMRPQFQLSVGDDNLFLRGNLRATHFDIFQKEEPHARILRRELRWGETYILSVSNIQEAPVYCALATALDNALFHNR